MTGPSTGAIAGPQARSADPAAYAIGGATPRQAVRAASADEVAETLRAAAHDGLTVVPWGAGVALAHETPPSRYDLALDLTALDRVIEYDPEDFTVTVECGVSIATLRATLAARGQELPLEAAHASRATVGGLLAADASGPRRLRFGAPHDRILGAHLVLADGTRARSGGKVVKNVAGYGTHRLLCGSRGGLAVIVAASLKIAPAPAARVALCYGMDAAALADAARWRRFPRLEPAWLTVVERSLAVASALRTDAPFTVVVGLEEEPAWAQAQESATSSALGAPAARLEGEPVAALLQALTDLEETEGPRLSFTTTANTPAALAAWLARPAAGPFVFHAPAGRLHLFPGAEDAHAATDAAAECGLTLIGARGWSGHTTGPAALGGLTALRARIRAGLDPAGTLALGEAWAAGRR